jgi:hypothetical protein
MMITVAAGVADILPPVLSAVVAAASALIGVLITQRQSRQSLEAQSRERQASESTSRRNEAAKSVGPTLALISNADMSLIVDSDIEVVNPEIMKAAYEHLETSVGQWVSLRASLFTLAASHPSNNVSTLALELVDVVNDYLTRALLFFWNQSTEKGVKFDREISSVALLIAGRHGRGSYHERLREDIRRLRESDKGVRDGAARKRKEINMLRDESEQIARKLLTAIRE